MKQEEIKDNIRYEIEDFFDNGERRKDFYKYNDYKILAEIVEKIAIQGFKNSFNEGRENLKKEIEKMIKENTLQNRYRDGETAFDICRDIRLI